MFRALTTLVVDGRTYQVGEAVELPPIPDARTVSFLRYGLVEPASAGPEPQATAPKRRRARDASH